MTNKAMRLPAVDARENDELEDIFAEIKHSRGCTEVSNALRSLGHSPEALRHFSRLGAYLKFQTDLSERERELTILCAARGVQYTWLHRVRLSLRVGIVQQVIDDVERGIVSDLLPNQEKAITAFVMELFSTESVSDSTFEKLKSYYSPRQITEIAMSAAYYRALGTVGLAFKIEIETPEQIASWNLH